MTININLQGTNLQALRVSSAARLVVIVGQPEGGSGWKGNIPSNIPSKSQSSVMITVYSGWGGR